MNGRTGSTGRQAPARGAQTGGGQPVQIASIVYNVPVSGTGLPNLSEDGIAAWVKDDPGTPEHLGQKPL
ncbi:hypothetical protein, partial [Escherichia coli]|uniref:hypothetical protein n=1 Tax=Escherichia coli TaxID=562 RepID=UPI00197EB8AA